MCRSQIVCVLRFFSTVRISEALAFSPFIQNPIIWVAHSGFKKAKRVLDEVIIDGHRANTI